MKTSRPKILDLATDVATYCISPILSNHDLAQIVTASDQANILFKKRLQKNGAKELLKHIQQADWEQVSKLAESNPSLMFELIEDSDDLSKKITPLKYAFKILDKYSQRIFLDNVRHNPEYLNLYFQQARAQTEFFDIKPLLQAYEEHDLIKKQNSAEEKIIASWLNVGKKQRELPRHFIKEFTRKNYKVDTHKYYQEPTSWRPDSKFDDKLPPINYEVLFIPTNRGIEVLELTPNSGLGYDYALFSLETHGTWGYCSKELYSAKNINHKYKSYQETGRIACAKNTTTLNFGHNALYLLDAATFQTLYNVRLQEAKAILSSLPIEEKAIPSCPITAEQVLLKQKSAWDSFEWDNKDETGLFYSQVNDPMIMESYTKHVLSLKSTLKSYQPLVVLDIGAGKGKLARKLLAETIAHDIPIHYILVEPGEKQLALAREEILNFCYYDTNFFKVTFIQSTLQELKLSEPVHCIISSGGPLNRDVVTRQQAKENVIKMAQLLRPNGVLIATGLTAFLVKAKQFKDNGLQVLSYATPCKMPWDHSNNEFLQKSQVVAGFFGHYQRYVCQKPANTKKAGTRALDSSAKRVKL